MIWIAWSVALAADAPAHGMSVRCQFGLLKQAHETLVFCGEQIDPASEARFERLSKEFQSFVDSNQDSKKVADDSVEEIRRRLRQKGRDQVCKDPDYSLLRRLFFHNVSDAGMDELSNLLSHPQDPSEGDCF